MDLKSILEYQKKDAELIKLERAINSNENKKIFTQMLNVVKETQNQSSALEKQAGDILRAYNSLRKTYEDNIKTANAIANKDLSKVSEDELMSIENIANTIASNLNILEKKLLAEAEKVRSVLANFENAKKRYNLAKEKHTKHKALFEQDSEKLTPEIEKKTSEVKKLEKNIDPTVLAKYKQKRQDNIYPVLVPCIDRTCGGCRMELPSASLSNLKKDGILECEHCRRIIYVQ